MRELATSSSFRSYSGFEELGWLDQSCCGFFRNFTGAFIKDECGTKMVRRLVSVAERSFIMHELIIF
jgi:hypothetical protein